jgi:hypothetical protein
MTIDSNQLINPTFFRSVKCHLKVCSWIWIFYFLFF